MKFLQLGCRITIAASLLGLAGLVVGCGVRSTASPPEPKIESNSVSQVSSLVAKDESAELQASSASAIEAEPSTTAGAAPKGETGDWGELTGQFVLDGDIPAVEKIKNEKEKLCAPEIDSEDLVVNKDNKGIADVFVYIPPTKKPANIHKDLQASKDKEAVLDQQGCHFIPHALILRTDQKLLVKSNDDFSHNTHTYPTKNTAINVIVSPKDRKGLETAFKVPENVPTTIQCDIHAWMSAYCLIIDHPYAAVSDKDGKFKIEKLPAGELEFRYWHTRPGYLIKVEKVVDGKPKVENTVKIKIEAGKTKDLGIIKVPAAKLAKQS